MPKSGHGVGLTTWLHVARRRLGYTQRELADLIGVTQPRISAWENGVAPIPDHRAERLGYILKIDAKRLAEDAYPGDPTRQS